MTLWINASLLSGIASHPFLLSQLRQAFPKTTNSPRDSALMILVIFLLEVTSAWNK